MAESEIIVARSKRETPANRRQVERLDGLTNRGLDQVLQAGFSGVLTLKVTVGDGTIQDVLKEVYDKER